MTKSRAIRPTRHLSLATALAVFVSIVFRVGVASARPEGIDSSRFTILSLGCNNCHQTQPPTALAPSVALSASSTSITTADQITLTFVVTSSNPTVQIAAGFNIRSSQRGTFAVGGSASVGTRTIANLSTQWLEATHSMPKNNDASNQATFTTLWTPMAAVNGTVTFTAWGNSVNLLNGNVGDRAASTTLDITVCSASPWYRDADGDGYGDPAMPTSACAQPAGYVSDHSDCNDGAVSVHPGAAEICNGVDDNCSGAIDEGVTTTYYRDADGDGYGAAAPIALGCSPPAGYVANNTDCNDGAAGINPAAAEICNGIDDNCAGGIDEGLPLSPFYFDADHDGYGNPDATKLACNLAEAGAGYVANAQDCNERATPCTPVRPNRATASTTTATAPPTTGSP